MSYLIVAGVFYLVGFWAGWSYKDDIKAWLAATF